MGRYLTIRITQSLVLVFVVTVVTFFAIHAAPGGPAILADPMLTREQAIEMAATLGLDRPMTEQYLNWLGHIARGQLGISFNKNKSVVDLIGERLPASLLLSGVGLGLAIALAIPLGIVSAARRNSWVDYLATSFSMFGLSVPAFWLGIMLIIVFAVHLHWLPSGGMLTPGKGGGIADRIQYLALPSVVITIFFLAQLVRYTRSSVIQVLKEDYVRTARAKGLSDRRVLYRHALKPALLPVVTMIGMMLPQVTAGAAITETVFSWPGIGRLAVEAAFQRDYPVIMGVTLLVSLAVVVANLATDIAYTWLDPRIRLR